MTKKKTTKPAINLSKSEPGKAPEAIIPAPQGENKQKDQQRTVIHKKLFLREYPLNRFIIKLTCGKIGISEETFFKWRKDDPAFATAIKSFDAILADTMEDVLKFLAVVEKDGPSIRYWLDRKHPDFKKSAEDLNRPGDTTIEQFLDVMDKYDIEVTEKTKKDGTIHKPQIHRDVLPDQGQKEPAGQVPIQPGAGVLLGEKNPAEHHPESPAKGTDQGHRRRSTRRVHTSAYERSGY